MFLGWKSEIRTIFVVVTMIFVVGSGLILPCQVSGRSSPDPIHFNIILVESYRAGEQDVIMLEIWDADDNVVENYTGTVNISVVVGECDVEGENDYNFTHEDRGIHSFIVTPLTFGENSTTLVFEDRALDIRENVTFSVEAGPVESLEARLDWEAMGREGPNGSYFAGDELYFTVYGIDKMGNPSSTYDAPIGVSHDFKTGDEGLVPEPWQSTDGSVILSMVDGAATNFPAQPFKLFGAGEVNLTFRSKVNLEIGCSMIVTVHPTYLDHLEALPGGPDEAPVTVDVKVGATQHFSVKGFDEFGNPIDIENAIWRVDADIKAMDTPDILIDGVFSAVEYFGLGSDDVVYEPDCGYSTRTGKLEVTAACPRDGRELKREITIRVMSDKDVWLDEEQVEPHQILIGDELELQANIYYDMPVTNLGNPEQASALGDLFEVTFIATLVDKDGNGLAELVNERVNLVDLNTRAKGVKIINVIVPWENFGDHVRQWVSGDMDSKNFLKVEIIDVPGGTDMSDFEKSGDNNVMIVELYGVPLPANGSDEGYLTGFDRDDDGMDDGWEDHYFDGDAKPGTDTDGDGLTNLEEFINGNDPLVKNVIAKVEDEGGLTDSGFVRILFIAGGAMLVLLVLVLLVAMIYKKKTGTVKEEAVRSHAHGRPDSQTRAIDHRTGDEPGAGEIEPDRLPARIPSRTVEIPRIERSLPPPPPDY